MQMLRSTYMPERYFLPKQILKKNEFIRVQIILSETDSTVSDIYQENLRLELIRNLYHLDENVSVQKDKTGKWRIVFYYIKGTSSVGFREHKLFWHNRKTPWAQSAPREF